MKPPCENRTRTTLKCRKACCRKKVEVPVDTTRQHQLGLFGSGDFCERGCCDFSEKFAKHACMK